MRHRVAHRKLGRVTEHRLALLRNQAQALLRHERIETTVARAKELRPFVERLITIAKRGLTAGDGRAVYARRLVRRDIPDRTVVAKLFDTIAPRFAGRPGGYVRILRLGYRRGDSAELAQVELLGSEYTPKAAQAKPEGGAPARKRVGEKLRAAAERLRGRREPPAETDAAKEAEAAKAEEVKAKSATASKAKVATRGAASKKIG